MLSELRRSWFGKYWSWIAPVSLYVRRTLKSSSYHFSSNCVFKNMMVLYLKRLIFTLLSSLQVFSFTLPTTHSGLDYSPSSCVPFKSSFSPSDVSQSQRTPFTGISSKDSYGFSESGMELYLDKPHGTIKTKGGENDKVAEGATVNSTFTLL